MLSHPPADVGMPLDEVDTPALVINLDAFERNLERMGAAVAGTGVRLRPHAKTHKCALIARRQIALGAAGVCCQKVSEAEALVHGGVPDVLISNEIVGRRKLQRLAALARHARVAVCADDPGNVADLGRAATGFGVNLDVLVEIDVGAHRCGVAPGAPAVELARQVQRTPGLRFAGLQAYQGRAQHLRGFSERRRASEQAAAMARATVEQLERAGLTCDTVTGAGTGTFRFEVESGVYNELQAGSYIFMDVDYGLNLKEDGGFIDDFENSLFVYTTVMSRPVADRAVVDAGLKALSIDSGMPAVHGTPEIAYRAPSDKHGILDLRGVEREVCIGDKWMLVPGHCDPTVNLYDCFVCVRDGRVEAVWPITARGAVL